MGKFVSQIVILDILFYNQITETYWKREYI